MTRCPNRTTRSAFTLAFAIIMTGVLLLFAVVLARFAVGESTAQKQAIVAAQAYQILLSARDWSRLHADQLDSGDVMELPLDAFAPHVAEGSLTLNRVLDEGGARLIECRLKLKSGTRSVYKHVYWPAGHTPPGTALRQ